MIWTIVRSCVGFFYFIFYLYWSCALPTQQSAVVFMFLLTVSQEKAWLMVNSSLVYIHYINGSLCDPPDASSRDLFVRVFVTDWVQPLLLSRYVPYAQNPAFNRSLNKLKLVQILSILSVLPAESHLCKAVCVLWPHGALAIECLNIVQMEQHNSPSVPAGWCCDLMPTPFVRTSLHNSCPST